MTKLCDPVDDPGLFNVLIDQVTFGANGNDVPCEETLGAYPRAVGTKTISLTAGTDTNLADYITTFGGAARIGGNCDEQGMITLVQQSDKVCVIMSVRLGLTDATLTLTKNCNTPGDQSQFEFKVGDLSLATLACGESTTAPIPLAPGPYTVREVGIPPASNADYTTNISGDCAANGSITLEPGQDAHCTFTNTRIPPTTTLRIDKACLPTEDTGRFNLTIDGVVKGSNVACGGTTGPLPVKPGAYTVGESGASGYTVVIGGDCASDGTVTIAAGQNLTCLVTNVHAGTPYAELSVAKICIPAYDGGRFALTVDGQTTTDRACGERFGPVAVVPGPHHVGESAGTGTDLVDYATSIGGGCAADGSITLAAGQSATCTITNVRRGFNLNLGTAQITIVKQCTPAGVTDRFQLSVDQTVFQDMKCGDSTGPVTVSTGDHSVGEVPVGGASDQFTATVTGDCSSDGRITLTAGQHATCTVTNVRRRVPPPPRPPARCYELSVSPQTVGAGALVPITAHVHLDGESIQGVRVYAAGPGVSGVRTTGADGRALFLLRLDRAGVLTLTIRQPYACPPPDPRKVAVLGALSFTG